MLLTDDAMLCSFKNDEFMMRVHTGCCFRRPQKINSLSEKLSVLNWPCFLYASRHHSCFWASLA